MVRYYKLKRIPKDKIMERLCAGCATTNTGKKCELYEICKALWVEK